MTCEICEDTGYVNVLDMWAIQRAHIEYGDVSIDSAEALPMIKNEVRCYRCHGEQVHNEDMENLKKKMGGSPWKEETFQP